MAGEVDLGSLMPSAVGEATSGAGNTWQGLVSDPVSRAAMMSFGLQLMTGGYGNGLQQIGVAGGKAGEAAGRTAGALQEQGNLETARADKNQEGAANRASHEKVANIAGDSRSEVANIRSQAMLERANLIHGPQNDKEMQIFAKARSDYMKKEKDNQLISKKTDQQITMEADTWAKDQLRGAREAVGVRSQGAALPADGPSGVGSATSGESGQSPILGKAPLESKGAPKPSWDQIKTNPRVQELIKTPMGRRQILNERPDLEAQINSEVPLYGN